MNDTGYEKARSAARLLVFGGIALVICGMVLGEFYAIFVSHAANGDVRRNWAAAISAIGNHDATGVDASMARIGQLQELRGRMMDTHSHIASYGLLAIALALLLPSVNYPPKRKVLLGIAVLAGGLAQGLFAFLRIYTGRGSSLLSDAGGVLLLAGCAGFLAGMAGKDTGKCVEARVLSNSASARVFARGGALLILLGMSFGFYYAWVFVTRDEPAQDNLLRASVERAMEGQVDPAEAGMLGYRRLQSKIAITAAAHSHVIEYGMLAILLGFLQPNVFLSERWKRRWAWVFVLASLAMGLCIFGATILGLRLAGLADGFGLLLIVSLLANLAGVVRRTGAEDASVAGGGERVSQEQKWLLIGGLTLVTAGLLFGLVYGALVQHDTLLVLKESYGKAVRAAAERDAATMRTGLEQGQESSYKLVRAVDVHAHIIKVGTVLLLAGLVFPLVGWSEKTKKVAALCFVAGSVIFPAGVFAEIFSRSVVPKAAAAAGALLAIASFAAILAGLFRGLGRQSGE